MSIPIDRAFEAEMKSRAQIPTIEKVEGYRTILYYQIRKQAPQIQQILNVRGNESETKRRKLIEDSNTLKPGEPDYLGKLHNIMNSKDPTQRNRLFDNEYAHYHRPRCGWGRWRNETRSDIQPQVDSAAINFINLKLTDAEQYHKPFQTNFLQLAPKK